MPPTAQAIAYLKAAVAAKGPAVELPLQDSPLVRPFADGLLLTYVVDGGDSYEFVQQRDLERDGVTADALHAVGLSNLEGLVGRRETRVQPYGNIFAVLMGGDFEASLIALDALWEGSFRQFVPEGDYLAALPARDILSFCSADSLAGRAELEQLVERISPGGDHLLTPQLYRRSLGRWAPT